MFSAVSFVACLLVASALGHSQMRCANYDVANNKCLAPIRNQVVSFESEAYDMTIGETGICQSRMSNPISASYSNGAGCAEYAGCPDPMGTVTAGQQITVMWFARNHAVADQTPGTVSIYLSPVESDTQGVETSGTVFAQNKICEAPYASCNGQNGDMVQCYATCTVPANTVAGIHTLWWKWVWDNHGSIYSTCADLRVTSSNGVGPAQTTGVAPARTTGVAAAQTTGVAPARTTGVQPARTTGVAPARTTGAQPARTTGVAAAQTTGVAPARTTGVQPARTTGVAAPVTTGAAAQSSGDLSLPCNLGEQKCVSYNTYRTCTNGRTDNYWAGEQSCQNGMHCVIAPNSNSNIWCVNNN